MWEARLSNAVQFSHLVMSNSLQPHGLQHTRLPCPSATPRACSNSCSLSGDAIQPFHPLSPSSPPAFNLSQHQGLFQWVSSSHQVAKYWNFSFSISPSNEYSGLISFQIDWLDLSHCSPRDSQESSPTSQFKSINFSVLSFLCSLTLTSIHDY